jgi:LAO/AO transport system kinase
MGDEIQAIKAGLLEVADLVVVNKGDRPGAQRTAAQLRAMLVAGAGRESVAGATGGRPRPKRPEVMITTAATGDGVPELLAALDRHRAGGGGADAASAEARLARAEAQVWAVVSDRVRARLHATARRTMTADTLAAVADHRLDPYTAADRLLASVDLEEHG